jgi:hypothetical protein
MTWQKMRIPGGDGPKDGLPGERGRYLLWLDPPYVEGQGHFVHFSWKCESFCIRDYVQHLERRQTPELSATQIWQSASERIPCKGEFYRPVDNFEFWTQKLTELTESRGQVAKANLWSRLSSKFAPKPNDPEPQDDENVPSEGKRTGLQRFKMFWKRGPGFDVVDRTVGCSARFAGEPLLWVYPLYFQVAPRGKGNTRHQEVLELRNEYFPTYRGQGTIRFESEHFTWDRFEQFIERVQEVVRGAVA